MNDIIFRAGMYAFDAQALLYFGGVLIVWMCTVAMVTRERPGRTLGLVVVHTLLITLWLSSRGIGRLATDQDYILFWQQMTFVILPLGASVMMHYIFVAIGLDRLRKKWIRLYWITGSIFALEPLLFGKHIVADIQLRAWGYEAVYGWMGYLLLLSITVGVARIILDFAHLWGQLRNEPFRKERHTALWISGMILFVTMSDFLVPAGVPVYPTGFITVPLYFLGITWVTIRYGLIDVSAEMAAERVLNIVRAPVLVLDKSGTIKAVNEATSTAVERTVTQLLNTSIGNPPDI